MYVYAGSVIVCSKEIERERRARSHRKGGNDGGGRCGGFGPSLVVVAVVFVLLRPYPCAMEMK